MARPTRIALVGRPSVLAACALEHPAGGVEPLAVPLPAGADPEAAIRTVADAAVAVAVVFEPEALPTGLVAELGVPTIGWSIDADPLAAGVDRRVVTGPALPDMDVWRSLPLPIADSGFGSPQPRGGVPRGLWLSGDDPRRREYVDRFETTIELIDDDLVRVLADTDIGVSLHSNLGAVMPHAAARSLAAGQLLVSDPIDPARGLEPGIDFIEGHDLGDIQMAIEAAGADLDAFRRIRIRGRLKAERLRASTVYPRLVDDLLQDVRVFGR